MATERVRVVEDGLPATSGSKPDRPHWLVGVVGFALGLGFGVLVVSPGPEPGMDIQVPTTAAIAAATETTVAAPDTNPGVVGAVEGFPDAIVAVARTQGSSLDHVLWPSEGEVTVRPMTGGQNVVLDTSSHFVALSNQIPGLDGVLLSMGRINSIEPVASNVLSYAWHDSDAAHLTFTQIAGDVAHLYTVRADLNPVLVAELSVSDTEVVAWGDWGWVIQRTPAEMVLLNPAGAFKDSEAGVAITSSGSGWVFAVDEDGAKLVSAGGGVSRIQAPLDVGRVQRAAFSPDGTRIAVVGSSGIVVLDVGTEEVTRTSGFTTPSVAWSSDSRFVLLAAPSGVAVVDLDEPIVGYRVLDNYPALAVGVLALRSS